MPKAKQKTHRDEEGEEEAPLHGVINEEEVHLHTQSPDKILEDMVNNIENEKPEAMKQVIVSFKKAITVVMPRMEEADPVAVLRVVTDPNCLAIHPAWKGEKSDWKN